MQPKSPHYGQWAKDKKLKNEPQIEYGLPFSKLQDLLKSEWTGVAGERLELEGGQSQSKLPNFVLIHGVNCLTTTLPGLK